jgi:hypothetical protein
VPAPTKGVAYNAPPAPLPADATKLAGQMAKGLPPSANGVIRDRD